MKHFTLVILLALLAALSAACTPTTRHIVRCSALVLGECLGECLPSRAVLPKLGNTAKAQRLSCWTGCVDGAIQRCEAKQ
jgi:hypothetical protein